MGGGAPGFRVRRLGPADAAAYRTLRLDSLRIDPESFGTLWEDEREQPLQHFADSIGRADAVGAFDGNTLVGIARLHDATGPRERHKGTVNGVFVDPAHRGRGIGHALLQALLARADERLAQVTLSVTATNHAAIALYERVGFRPYGCEPRARTTATGWSDTLLMVRLPEASPPG